MSFPKYLMARKQWAFQQQFEGLGLAFSHKACNVIVLHCLGIGCNLGLAAGLRSLYSRAILNQG